MEGVDQLLQDHVIKVLNDEFGNDILRLSNVQDLLSKVKTSESELERKLHPVIQETSQVESFTKAAENALQEIKERKHKNSELQREAKSLLSSLMLTNDDFSECLSSIQQLEILYSYLQWVSKIEDINCLLEDALKQNITSYMVSNFLNLKEIWNQLQFSKCRNLVSYVERNVLYWHDILKDKFGSEFQKILFSLHWPVLSSNLSAPINQSAELITKFNGLFMTLFELQLPDGFPKPTVDNCFLVSSLLPLQLMLQPLQKRFVFHFMGKKQTNRLDKPEWYLTQILSWITDNSLFMEGKVQLLLDKLQLSSVQARAEMMQGLVNFAILRLQTDLPSLMDDDNLLSHTIDEVLLFENELRNQGYPPNFPNILEILTKEPCFTRWRSLEHKNALEKMDKLLNASNAWKPCYQEEQDLDELHIPECAETFMTLLLTMTERYCNLPSPACHLSFFELQLELLDDFRLRLHQLSHCQVQEPLETNFCAIINAVHYVVTVLNEWDNLPFFLQLYCYIHPDGKKTKSTDRVLSEVLCPRSDTLYGKGGDVHESDYSPSSEDDQNYQSVFEEAIGLLQHMQKDLLQTLGERVMLDIKAKSRPYRKEKWFCLPTIQDRKSMEVSCLAYPLLEIINHSLHILQELLAKPLFTITWQYIARELNLYLYEEVILQNSFSEGGAAQLQFDMMRNLFPIFGNYTQKPESYFKFVKEACTLLNLSHAPAVLLCETLRLQEEYSEKNNSLEELGVQSLSPSQAQLILTQRNDIHI